VKPFLLASEAVQDLDEIWEYIAQDNLDAGDRLIESLYENMLKLVETPGLGHTREDLVPDRRLLFWPVGNYLILYRTRASSIEIVAVVHGKRDVPAFIRRREL
jgi:plasmid stabilization system protein ParE